MRMPLLTPEVTEMVAMITDSRISEALHRQVFRDLEQHLEAVVELHHADAQRGGDAEDGAEHRGDVHAVGRSGR